MKQINIFPIFNQSVPGVWTDFANIQMGTVYDSYNYAAVVISTETLIQLWRSSWNGSSNNYAFGAYDGGRMIGYINGTFAGYAGVFVNNLYVLPRYHGMHVGTRLLNSVEQIAALNMSSVSLYSLESAWGFYRRRGYQADGSDTVLYKLVDLSVCKSSVVPVFKPVLEVTQQCDEIARQNKSTYIGQSVLTDHLPVFAYVDASARIAGYLVGLRQQSYTYRIAQMYVKPNAANAKHALVNAFDSWAAHQKSIAAHR